MRVDSSESRPFTEQGKASLGISTPCPGIGNLNQTLFGHATYMLQNEIGAHLFAKVDFKTHGNLVFRTKGSYVNRYYFSFTHRSKFVGSSVVYNTAVKLPDQGFAGASAETTITIRTSQAV